MSLSIAARQVRWRRFVPVAQRQRQSAQNRPSVGSNPTRDTWFHVPGACPSVASDWLHVLRAHPRGGLAAIESGESLSAVSRDLGINRSTLRAWRESPGQRRVDCSRCDGFAVDGQAYAALLGFYLGDGCISRHARYYSFRVSCDAKYSGIVADVERVIDRVRPGR